MLYNFILKNLTLSIILLILLIILITIEIISYTEKKYILKPSQVIELINHHNAIIIDVRTTTEYNKQHIINSINIPYKFLESDITVFKKYRNKTVIIIHSKNSLAKNTIKLLNKIGINNTFYIKNGINSWIKENLPTKKGKYENKNIYNTNM